MNWFRHLVRFWDRREGAEALALVRMLVGAVILLDLAQVEHLDLVLALFGPAKEGGIGTGGEAAPTTLLVSWFGSSALGAELLVAFGMSCATALCVGCYSRVSALLLLLCYAQLAKLSPGADRGIDVLLRNSLLVLGCSGAGETWSWDAYRRYGRITSTVCVQAWPRYLLIAQLILLYFWAGIQKQSAAWTTIDDYSALFIVLNEPHYARFDFPHAWLSAAYPLLQFSTVATLIFERSAVLIPIVLWLRATRSRGGLLRTVVVESHVFELWVATGAFFHVGLAVVAQLGIFPWGCLALYPALAQPRLIAAGARKLTARTQQWLSRQRQRQR